MALVQRYNGGRVARLQSPVAPLTGQTFNQPTQAVGDALQGAGQMLTQMHAAQAKAQDARHMLEANNAMQAETMDFAKWQQANPDEQKWLDQWQQRVQRVQGELDKRQVTPAARTALMGNFANWSNSQTMQLQGQVLKQSGQRAMDAAQVTINNAVQNRDFGSGVGAIDTLVATGILTPEAGELRKQEIENNVKAGLREDAKKDVQSFMQIGATDAAIEAVQSAPFEPSDKRNMLIGIKQQDEFNKVVLLAKENPQEAKKVAQTMQMDGAQRVKLYEAIDNEIKRQDSNGVSEWMDLLKTFGAGDKEQTLGNLAKDKRLSDISREQLRQFIERGPVNDPVEYSNLYAEVKQFEGQEGTKEYANLLNKIQMSQNGQAQSSLIGLLDEVVKAPKTMQSRAINAVYASLSDQLKEGWFGEYRGRLDDPQTVLPENMRNEIATLRDQLLYSDASKAERERALSDPEYMKYWEREARKKWHDNLADKNKGFFTGYMIDDAARKQKAAERYQNVLADLEQWHRQHQDATAAELRAKAGDLTAEARKQAKLNNDATLLMPTPAAEPDAKSVLDRIKKIK